MKRKSIYYPDLLLSKFLEFHDKQDVLTKLNSRDLIQGYGTSETNCVDKIGKLEQPNVTKIAKEIHLSRSAVSKIVKKLISSGDVVSYQKVGNQKEIYYKLTDKGQLLFDEHRRRHNTWEERELRFFKSMREDDFVVICKFLTDFNKYLDRQIKELKK